MSKQAEPDRILATAILAALDFCPACGAVRPVCSHMAALRRLLTEPRDKVYVVFSYGDPMPITACATVELAEQYADALALLPADHPLYTEDGIVDELPLNTELPAPLAALSPSSVTVAL